MANVSENPLPPKMLGSINNCAASAREVLGLSAEATPERVVEAIDTFVYRWQKGTRPAPKELAPDDAPLIIGSLWGNALVQQFGWEWRMITFHDHGDSVAPGVLSSDRALAIYPIHFLMGCFRDPHVDATILLSFNMLLAGKVKPGPARAYSNVMERVQRIVPRS